MVEEVLVLEIMVVLVAVLAVEADKLLRQQGQVERVNVLTY